MIHRYAVVENSKIHQDAEVMEFAVVRTGAKVGSRVKIHPHTVIESGVTLEEGVEVFPGAYIGKKPTVAGAATRPTESTSFTTIREGTVVGPNACIYIGVEIGRDCLIADGAAIREGTTIGDNCLLGRYVTVQYACQIGNRVKIIDLTHITGKMTIGDDAFISTGVFTANDNDPHDPIFKEEALRGPVIGAKALVAAGATILPGVNIGESAIVAAGSVVTKDVRPESRVMGVPARER